MENIRTKPSSQEYRSGWERIFGGTWGDATEPEEEIEYALTLDGRLYPAQPTA